MFILEGNLFNEGKAELDMLGVFLSSYWALGMG